MYNAHALSRRLWKSPFSSVKPAKPRTRGRTGRIEMSSATGARSEAIASPETLTRQTDEELLLQYRLHASRGAFEELVRRYERELYSYLRRYMTDATLAEDVFQATFLQLHLKADQFEEGRKVRPWLYTIATNQAIDAQRRNRRHKMVSLDRRGQQDAAKDDVGSLVELLTSREPGAASNLEGEERREWIRQAIADLPDALREAVLLVYYQGMKYREAADVLGIPVGTVKSRMHAAILKLNEAWTQTHPAEHE
jgi:RNA polymerase sigma-70 factor (ECF subfamily)